MEYDSAIKRNELLINATAWINLQRIILSKKTSPKRLHTVLFHLYNILEMNSRNGELINVWLRREMNVAIKGQNEESLW